MNWYIAGAVVLVALAVYLYIGWKSGKSKKPSKPADPWYDAAHGKKGEHGKH